MGLVPPIACFQLVSHFKQALVIDHCKSLLKGVVEFCFPLDNGPDGLFLYDLLIVCLRCAGIHRWQECHCLLPPRPYSLSNQTSLCCRTL
jgi:hypothetical protein